MQFDKTAHAAQLLAEAERSTETIKMSLARSLHDELGDLLVAALMDVAWVRRQIDSVPETRSRLRRIEEVLALAIEEQRWLLAELRPALLEGIGSHTPPALHRK